MEDGKLNSARSYNASWLEGEDLERHHRLQTDSFDFAHQFREEHERSSDRALVIVGAAFLDALLEYNLAAFFVEDSKEAKPLLSLTYNHKTRLAYCLGLIPATVRDDLRLVGQIRNKFAHRLDASFAQPEIRRDCVALKWHRSVFMTPPEGASDRDLFYVGVNQMVGYLGGAVSLARGDKRLARPDPASWE